MSSKDDPIKQYIYDSVLEILKTKAELDVGKIIEALEPKIDELIAKKVKEHMSVIGQYIHEKFNDIKEK